MKVLVTGAGGYIGRRIIPALLEEGHHVVACLRNKKRFNEKLLENENLEVVEADFMKPETCRDLPRNIEAAYYFLHSMSNPKLDFYKAEEECINNFIEAIRPTSVSQIIYLSGITNEPRLSKHLSSREHVEKIIRDSGIAYTILRASIIIGSASASFEIIRDLVEKIPVMVTPKWVKSRSQPISIFDVLYYLKRVLGHPKCMNQGFEIGGPDILTYKEILLGFAKKRGLRRWIVVLPVLTPKLSSYWLYFVTSTNYFLAKALVDSLQVEVICKDRRILDIIPHRCLTYREALDRTFQIIDQNEVISGWKDSIVMSGLDSDLSKYAEIPKHGCFSIERYAPFSISPKAVIDELWQIGGNRGWFYMNWTWKIRGIIDKMFGGVGLRRGRTHNTSIQYGDVIDFWRVITCDREEGRLLLFAEMKTPGEAWLEVSIVNLKELSEKIRDRKIDLQGDPYSFNNARPPSPKKGEYALKTHAIFRPRGIMGRFYWYSLYPIHILIFDGLGSHIVKSAKKKQKQTSL